jgi:AcrR family transcriptional regulator
VLASQLSRLRRAMIELSAERGYENVTVRSLTRLAGVSTRSFYKHFANVGECFAYTYESLMEDGLRRAAEAQAGSEDLEEAVRASLESLLADLHRHPKVARLLLVEAFAAGPALQPSMTDAIGGFERLLSDTLADGAETLAVSGQIVEGAAAATMRVARTRLLDENGVEPAAISDEVRDWMLSLPGQCAPPEPPDRGPFQSLSRRNGHEPREDPGPTVLGGVGEERGRILSAAVKLAATGGFSDLRIPKIRAEAGVSRRSFDARFVDAAECFLEAIEAVATAAASRAQSAAREATSWERRIYLGIRALCEEAARNPVLARLTFVDIFAPGREGLRRRERLISLAAERLRNAVPPEWRPSELIAEASAAAAWRIAQAEVAEGRAKDLPRLLPVLAYVALAPVVGPAAAAEVIQLEELHSPG